MLIGHSCSKKDVLILDPGSDTNANFNFNINHSHFLISNHITFSIGVFKLTRPSSAISVHPCSVQREVSKYICVFTQGPSHSGKIDVFQSQKRLLARGNDTFKFVSLVKISGPETSLAQSLA